MRVITLVFRFEETLSHTVFHTETQIHVHHVHDEATIFEKNT